MVKPVSSTIEAPVPGRPKRPDEGWRHPRPRNPVVPLRGIVPVARRPLVARIGQLRLLVHRQRRRSLIGIKCLLSGIDLLVVSSVVIARAVVPTRRVRLTLRSRIARTGLFRILLTRGSRRRSIRLLAQHPGRLPGSSWPAAGVGYRSSRRRSRCALAHRSIVHRSRIRPAICIDDRSRCVRRLIALASAHTRDHRKTKNCPARPKPRLPPFRSHAKPHCAFPFRMLPGSRGLPGLMLPK